MAHEHESNEVNVLTRQTVSNSLKIKSQENRCKRSSKLSHNEFKNNIEVHIETHNDCTLI